MIYVLNSDNTISRDGRFVGMYVVKRENNHVVGRHVSPIGTNGQPVHDKRVAVPDGLKTVSPEFQEWLGKAGF